MRILFKARSGKLSTSTGILLIRLSLGFIFLFAGAEKILHLQDFITSIQSKAQMNNSLAFILAFILPFMEMLFGALYIIGLFTPVTSFFISVMTVSFMVVLGTGHPELAYSYNFVFLACALATMFMGAGLFSFDALIDREKKERNITVSPPVTVVKDVMSTPVKDEMKDGNKNEGGEAEKEIRITVESSDVKEDPGKQ
ncbi:MAG: DoxX family protein [Bacteroidetes bacterium]|nr:DoxX family protein [Bacteroidota bacterium]